MHSPHSQHRLSPSFTDSAIDMDLSDSGQRSSGTDAHATALPDRLTRLAHMAADRSPLSEHDSITVHRCLDTIESLLDPRPELSVEIARHRPRSSFSSTTKRIVSCPSSASAAVCPTPSTTQATQHQLANLLEELTAVNAELLQRRNESRHIHDLFTHRCEGLEQRIAQLESDIHELQSDILEDSIDLEGLRGTVRGLESWVESWRQDRELAKARTVTLKPQRKKRLRRSKHSMNVDDGDENDSDALVDGISAWMRGWKDIEEVFRIRAQERKLRRDRKWNQQIKALSPNVDSHDQIEEG